MCSGCHRKRELPPEERWIESNLEDFESADTLPVDTFLESREKKQTETKPEKKCDHSSQGGSSYHSSHSSSSSYDEPDIDDEGFGIYDDETDEHYYYGGEYDEDNIYDYENFSEDEGDF